jgi:predicted nuclease with TOPRIM domain
MTADNWLTIFLALIAALPGIGALYAQSQARRKTAAETTAIFVDTAKDLIEPLRCELALMRDQLNKVKAENVILTDRVERLEVENADLRRWAEMLVHQVKSLGFEPVQPRKRTPDA